MTYAQGTALGFVFILGVIAGVGCAQAAQPQYPLGGILFLVGLPTAIALLSLLAKQWKA